jgi:capsid protein
MSSRLRQLKAGIASIGKAFGWNQHYESSERYDRNRASIWATADDQNKTLTASTRKDLLAISRTLSANSGLYRGACQLLGRYAVVGFPQSQSADRRWAEAAEAGFREWAKIPEVTGRLTWLDIQRQWNYGVDRDGDIGNILTDSDFPQLQLIEAHRIESDATDEAWIDGVKINAQGRPVAFRVRNGNKYADIPANAFLLVGEPNRASGTRYECAWAAGLNHVRDIKEITGHLKTMVKNESAIALIKKVRGGVDSTAATDDWRTDGTRPDGSAGAQLLEKIYGGKIPRLDTDEEMQSFATDRPSTNITAFLEFVIRDFCTGNGLPFEFVWNPSALGGPSQRFVINMAQRRIAERQALIERHANRVYGWVVAKLAKRGDIPPMPEDWYRLTWQRPAEITIDVGREQAQDRADFQAGLIDPAQFYGKQGLDVDDVLASRVSWAKKILVAAGLPESPIPIQLLYQSTPNGNAQTPAPAATPTEEPVTP